MPEAGSNLSRCPKCDGPVTVKDSRITTNGWRYRRRRCNDCVHTWTTYEVPAELLEHLRVFVAMVQSTKQQIEHLEALTNGLSILDKNAFDQ